MKRLGLILAISVALAAGRAGAQGVRAEDVAGPFPVPMAEGLFRIQSAEPLGKGGFSIRYLGEAYQIEVQKVGEGTSVTGHVGIGYGLAKGLDFTVSVPMLLDLAGGLAKYGTGDVATSLKLGLPSRFPSGYYFGLELGATHPYAYKGHEALNVRPFGRGGREIATRILFDLNREAVGFRMNLGYLLSSGSRDPGLIYGGGVEVGRGQIFTVTAEYLNEPRGSGKRTARAVFGGHMNLWWLQVEVGAEKGISKDLPNVAAVAGLRIHTTLGRKTRKFFGGRVRRIPVSRAGEEAVRVAVVNFAGFEHHGAGQMVADRIKTTLAGFGHIRVVEVGTGAEFLDPDAAVRLAQVSEADVVITGRILRYELSRSARPNLPLVVGFPETVASLEADIRVVDRRDKGEILAARLAGTGRQNRGVRLFPTPGDDRTSYLNVVERERVWEEAIRQMVEGLVGEIAQTFTWLPG